MAEILFLVCLSLPQPCMLNAFSRLISPIVQRRHCRLRPSWARTQALGNPKRTRQSSIIASGEQRSEQTHSRSIFLVQQAYTRPSISCCHIFGYQFEYFPPDDLDTWATPSFFPSTKGVLFLFYLILSTSVVSLCANFIRDWSLYKCAACHPHSPVIPLFIFLNPT